MKRKILCLLLAMVMLFAFASCNKEENSSSSSSGNSSSSEQGSTNSAGDEESSSSSEGSSPQNSSSSIEGNSSSQQGGNSSSSQGGNSYSQVIGEYVNNGTSIATSDFITGAYNEALYLTWPSTSVSGAEVYVMGENDSDFKKVDNELIRQLSGKARVDIVGLKVGTYAVKVKPAGENNFIEIGGLKVTSNHDRSGFAHHFAKFTNYGGIGAYKDDGTLKDGAIVIYVTPENMNTVTVPGYEYLGTGIGYILNTQNSTVYSSWPRGVAKITEEHPVCVRLIGKITNPAGNTERYNEATGWYAPDKENGCQAKINGVKNLTIEGIGTDACIDGWGVAISSDQNGISESVEIRNLTIQNNPEDAVSIIGTQTVYSSNYFPTEGVDYFPVRYAWVHNNRFNKGYCANPTESDKADGDGSLDVKRCEYVTLSYNHLKGCKKTGLCGGDDGDMQNGITYHHNWYENCNARCPLARQANIHMYNNYFSGNNSTISARANVYIFSEYNYYENCSNTCVLQSGGVVKSFNDEIVNCSGTSGFSKVSSRDQAVSNNNAYGANNNFWKNFDTQSIYFYYSKTLGRSNVSHLTDAQTAKQECMAFSGPIKN